MSEPEFYKAPRGWPLLAALIGAVTIEAIAVAAGSLAKKEKIPADNGVFQDQPVEGIRIEEPPESPPSPPEDLPPPLPPPPTEIPDFLFTEPSPPLRSATRPKAVVKVDGSRADPGRASGVNFVSGRSNMIFSPHPVYPFEARRAKQTGSGKFLLRFDSAGDVTQVDAVESTGSPLLDQVSIRTLRQWRCKPGVYEKVYVPITFTMQGVQL